MKRRAPTSGKSAPGQRQLRVGERVRHILARILRDGQWNDPALENASLISVTEVSVSPDLKNATAYVMPLGGRDAQPIVKALNRAAGYFRAELGGELGLRYTPKVIFKADDSFDNALHIESLLRQERVRKDVETAAADAGDGTDSE